QHDEEPNVRWNLSRDDLLRLRAHDLGFADRKVRLLDGFARSEAQPCCGDEDRPASHAADCTRRALPAFTDLRRAALRSTSGACCLRLLPRPRRTRARTLARTRPPRSTCPPP